MMSVEQDFRHRLNEVSFYLRSLKDIEKRQATQTATFYRSARALAASRAAAFIMIYNCVEYGTKEAIGQIKIDAAANVIRFEDLVDHWKMEIIRHRFRAKLSSGINFDSFLEELKIAFPLQPTSLNNPQSLKSLPFGGNINHERLINFARKLGDARWRPPRKSLGGSDLELIRNARNQLAHGEESFEAIGSQYSIADIFEKLIRIRNFMSSYLRMLERYRVQARYRIN